jgi:hypothetical protein
MGQLGDAYQAKSLPVARRLLYQAGARPATVSYRLHSGGGLAEGGGLPGFRIVPKT